MITETDFYNSLNSKQRKKYPMRPRLWNGKLVEFIRLYLSDKEIVNRGFSMDWDDIIDFWYVKLDNKTTGVYWRWSDDKRSGRGAETMQEWETRTRRREEDNGKSFNECISDLLGRATEISTECIDICRVT